MVRKIKQQGEPKETGDNREFDESGRTIKEKKKKSKQVEDEGILAKGARGVSNILGNVPLVGGVYRGAEKLAAQTIAGGAKAANRLGFDVDERRTRATQEFAGLNPDDPQLLRDKDVQNYLLTGAGGALVGKFGGAVTGKLGFAETTTALSRGIVGKSSQFGLNKIGAATRQIAARFGVNGKSNLLTKSMLGKIIKRPEFLIGAIGSYPFAGFLKEEAVQTLSFPISTAIRNGDLAGAARLTQEVDEIIANKDNIMSKIPYANVLSSLGSFFQAANKSNNQWKQEIERSAGRIK